MERAPHPHVQQCLIIRHKSMFPRYQLFLEQDDAANIFLAAARRRPKFRSPNYLFSLDEDDMRRNSKTFLGKIRANFLGTHFMIYDDGVSPDKGETHVEAVGGRQDDEPSRPREEMAYIRYQYNLFGLGGPRKMEVLLPQVDPETKKKSVFLATSGGGVRKKRK